MASYVSGNFGSWRRFGDGLRHGRIDEGIVSAGWRWKVPSEGAIWLWLNCAGDGLVWGKRDRFILKPGMYALTGGGEPADWVCLRYPGKHQLEVLVIDPTWLRARLLSEWVHPDMRAWLEDGCPVAFCGLMSMWEQDVASALQQVNQLPRALIAEAKVLEWAAVRLFRSTDAREPTAFCAQVGRQDPVRLALSRLRMRLAEPLSLEDLAGHCGVAPHYLSRRVRRDTGATLKQHLRRLRVEHACSLLTSGRMNITEAALEVGYQSISHFAKAFREELGEAPREWLARRRSAS